VSGTTSSGPDGQPLFPGDTRAQTADAIARGLEAVAALGGTFADVIRTRIYLDPEADWEGAAKAHQEAFTDVAPANTMLHVATLIGPGLLAEVEIEALLLEAPGEDPS
jgi:enamine deaminase RidA (YjgF/YER057c/UK114 family)